MGIEKKVIGQHFRKWIWRRFASNAGFLGVLPGFLGSGSRKKWFMGRSRAHRNSSKETNFVHIIGISGFK